MMLYSSIIINNNSLSGRKVQSLILVTDTMLLFSEECQSNDAGGAKQSLQTAL